MTICNSLAWLLVKTYLTICDSLCICNDYVVGDIMSLCPFTQPGIVLLPGIVTLHHLLPECLIVLLVLPKYCLTDIVLFDSHLPNTYFEHTAKTLHKLYNNATPHIFSTFSNSHKDLTYIKQKGLQHIYYQINPWF